jgi:3-dehydroquinate dehydratase/shikimate dehydrogenase
MKNSRVRICVPVCVRRAGDVPHDVERAAEVGDIIELRLDCLDPSELADLLQGITQVVDSNKRSIILTLRPADFGGMRSMSPADRLRFRIENSWLVVGKAYADFWDVEIDLALIFQQKQKEGNGVSSELCNWSRTICSYHDFTGMPANLDRIYQEMAATESRILKIAAQANDATDCLPILALLEQAQREGRELIAIAMGQAGIMTRILGPSRGSYLTYGSLDDESATAPGQVTARELREVYRIDRIDPQTEITGLVGQPVAHSISPHIHNAAFAKADVNAVFIPFEVTDVDAFVRRMVRPISRELDWNLRGFSVTAPHKSAVMKHLDWIEPAAKEIGAVNTIVVRDESLHGYNTDAAAFAEPLKGRFESLENVRCAVIGAGGASRAIVWALRKAGASITLFARHLAKAKSLADELQIDAGNLSTANFDGFEIVINATPLGTRGKREQETPATTEQFRGVRLAYDLVYNPIETRFICEARAAGCETLGGLEMLIAQAVEQFRLWTDRDPDIEAMRAAAEQALNGTA